MEKNKNNKSGDKNNNNGSHKKMSGGKKRRVYTDNINPEHKNHMSVSVTVTEKRYKELEQFCKKLNIHFSDFKLLHQAFIHRSVINENKNVENNERLEFLGDSVLGMATAAYLYNSLDNPEGDLAKIKASVVSEKSLAPIALKFGVDKLLVLGRGEMLSDGMHKPAILADCLEAIIGAYYLDAGYSKASEFVRSFIGPEIHKACVYGVKDFKTLLQEKYQQYCKNCPKYKVVGKSGPEHDRVYSVTVQLGDQIFGPTSAKAMKEAERLAAKVALDNFDFTK